MAYKRKTKVAFVRLEQELPYDQSYMDEIRTMLEKTLSSFHGHPLFLKLVADIAELHSVKNKQYANTQKPLGNFIRTGRLISKLLKPGINSALAACLCLVAKQIDAVYDIVGEGKVGTVESVEDKLKDWAVYALIGMCIIEEIKAGNKDFV